MQTVLPQGNLLSFYLLIMSFSAFQYYFRIFVTLYNEVAGCYISVMMDYVSLLSNRDVYLIGKQEGKADYGWMEILNTKYQPWDEFSLRGI